MSRPFYFRIKDGVYRSTVHVVVGGTWDSMAGRIERREGGEVERDLPHAWARHVGITGKNISYIWISEWTSGKVPTGDFAVLMHECIHVAFHILDVTGVAVTNQNHEALTYLTECFFFQALSRLWDKFGKRRRGGRGGSKKKASRRRRK